MRSRVVVLVGLPGSGKSTWGRAQGLPVVSSDELRCLLSDDAANQAIHGRVFSLARRILRERLELGCALTCIDATNLTLRERQPYIRIAAAHGAVAEAVYFDVPAAVCKARNRGRQHVVPEEAIDEMAARIVPPSTAEGFARIRTVRDGGASADRS